MTSMVFLLAKFSSIFFMLIFFSPCSLQILGPWKRKCLCEAGVATQCISPLKITEQYLTNVLLKINSKVV